MREMALLLAALCLAAVAFSGCLFRVQPERGRGLPDAGSGRMDGGCLTGSRQMIGKRRSGKESCTGQYRAECRKAASGQDVICGGRLAGPRSLRLHGQIHTESGRAVLYLRRGGETVRLPVGEDGSFSAELALEAGANELMIRYQQFTGTVECSASCPPGTEGKRWLP